MVIGAGFAWAHLPKTGGDATLAMFGLFPDLVEFADPDDSNDKHASFHARAAKIQGKLLVMNIRRLPAWVLSRAQHVSRWGIYPDYEPIPMATPDELADSPFPDSRLMLYTDEGRFWPDRWLRMESLAGDFTDFVSSLRPVSDMERGRVEALGPVNSADYDHDARGVVHRRADPAHVPQQPVVGHSRAGAVRQPLRGERGGLMPVWEILELVEPPEAEEHLRTWFVEIPRGPEAGELYSQGDLFQIDIKGWVVGRHAKATAVELVYHGHVVRSESVRGARADLAPAFPDVDPELDMHFHMMMGVVGLRPEFELTLQAVLENGMRVPMAHFRARHEPLRSGYDPLFRPLVVTCLGRSGTTWLMQMLRHHREIVVYDKHPYEQAHAKYWMHMLRVLSQPADWINSYSPVTFHNEIFELGYNPFYDLQITHEPWGREWYGREYIKRLAHFCQSSIDGWYSAVAGAYKDERPMYFAEKHLWPNYIPVLIWELYPNAKEIFLVRDFRDMVFSILAFDRKRGYSGFGRPEGRSDEDYVRMELRDMALNLRKSWINRRDRAHLVRYEDLVLNPRDTARAILEYLELDATDDEVTRLLAAGAPDSDQLRHHRTTKEAEESIGRWQREGDERFRSLCNEVFGDILGDFGYSEVGYAG